MKGTGCAAGGKKSVKTLKCLIPVTPPQTVAISDFMGETCPAGSSTRSTTIHFSLSTNTF